MKRRVRNLLLLPVVLSTVLTAACGNPAISRAVYGSFSDVDSRDRAKEDVAVLDRTLGVYVVQIVRSQDQTVVYTDPHDGTILSRFVMTPGKYSIEYTTGPYMGKDFRTDIVDLKAGHRYLVKKEKCFPVSRLYSKVCRERIREYDGTVWIEDEKTGEVVAGEKW